MKKPQIMRKIIAIILAFAFIGSLLEGECDSLLEGDSPLGRQGQSLLAPQSRIVNVVAKAAIASSKRASSHIEKAQIVNEQSGMVRRLNKILIKIRWGSKKKNTELYPKEVERRISDALDMLYLIYGAGLIRNLRGVVVMPNLKGASLSELRHGVIRIDESAIETQSPELLMDLIEHALWYPVISEIDDNIGIQEMVAIYQSLRRFNNPNYDLSGGMEDLDEENRTRLRHMNEKKYQDNLLASLDKGNGIDPDKKSKILYEKERDIFEDVNLEGEDAVGKTFENIAIHIFSRSGYEKEKEALRKLRGGRVDIIERAKEALKKLDRKRELLMLRHSLTTALSWKEILRITSMTRTADGSDDIDFEIGEMARREAGRMDFSGLLTDERNEVVSAVIERALSLEGNFIKALKKAWNKEGADHKRTGNIIDELRKKYELDEETFEKYKYMILFQILKDTLFEAVASARSAEGVEKVRLVFRGGKVTLYAKANGKAGFKEATRAIYIPVFLQGLCLLLDGHAIEMAREADENGLWMFLEDLMEYTKLDPIGAYLTIRAKDLDVPQSGSVVMENKFLVRDEYRDEIAKINEGRKRIFVIEGSSFDAKAIVKAVQAEDRNLVFVVSDLRAWDGIIGFVHFKAEPELGIYKILRLANGIVTNVIKEDEILHMIAEINPRLYQECCEAGVILVFKRPANKRAFEDATARLASHHDKVKIISYKPRGKAATEDIENRTGARAMP